MKKTKIAKAMVKVLAGASLSLGVISTASAHVMYNTAIFGSTGTDGWTGAFGGNIVPWEGTEGGVLPYGFVGYQALNWAATIHSAGSAVVVSQADAIDRYGLEADIDTSNGAWGSWQVDPNNPAFTRGWAHGTDFGLIKSLVDTDIVVEVSKVNAEDNLNNFGITVFTGMDDGTAFFGHHSPWNIGYISGVNEDPAKVDNPFGTHGVEYLTHGDQSTVTFHAIADQVYSIYLGGNDVDGDIIGTQYAYQANISAVPVPAAIWLFGSGVVGLVSLGVRKRCI